MHAPQTEADQLSGPSIHVHPVVTGRGAKRFPLIRPHPPPTHQSTEPGQRSTWNNTENQDKAEAYGAIRWDRIVEVWITPRN